jgi:hypothetical protein
MPEEGLVRDFRGLVTLRVKSTSAIEVPVWNGLLSSHRLLSSPVPHCCKFGKKVKEAS